MVMPQRLGTAPGTRHLALVVPSCQGCRWGFHQLVLTPFPKFSVPTERWRFHPSHEGGEPGVAAEAEPAAGQPRQRQAHKAADGVHADPGPAAGSLSLAPAWPALPAAGRAAGCPRPRHLPRCLVQGEDVGGGQGRPCGCCLRGLGSPWLVSVGLGVRGLGWWVQEGFSPQSVPSVLVSIAGCWGHSFTLRVSNS